MQSQLTVRLSEDLDKEITDLSRKLRLKRSDIVRMALEKFLEDFNVKEETAPYERVKDSLGMYQAESRTLDNHTGNTF